MELVLGALPSLIPKLGELLADEYKLQKEVKGGIMFLRDELETMKAALQHISKIPADQLPDLDKIWARNVRELSYDIEDNIDTFMVQVKGHHQPTKKHGFFQKFIDKTLGSLAQPKIRRKIAIDIRDIKDRVTEVHDRRRRYEVNNRHSVDNSVKVDPRALVRYEKVSELVGIEESKDEVIEILMEANDEVSKQKNKIVSIVGFGGLGKTTLANVVYEKLKPQFDCSAFVSVSQTPDMDRLFRDMFYQLAKCKAAESINVIDELREFLREKRYFVVIDDVWEISDWNVIRCALLLDGTAEFRIITTTRIFTVAEQIGCPYKMRPLSLENSRILMYGRIFGKEHKDKCRDEQLDEVSNRILKKCDGVPLAIITIASLLVGKGRNKLGWYDVCNSIGDGLEKNNTIENMRKVLSLSYYDMPSHLRTCLLYLSMFPEDYDIRKGRLIWLWIAEGFIQSGKQGKSLFEIGESYLNELINRSMIQPIYDDEYSGMVESCRVHDMVLDLIRSLSSEENFVTLWNHVGHSSAPEKVRRLSLQNGEASHGKLDATLSMEHVRSAIVFPFSIDHIPTLENFRVLRVLDLEGCDLSQGYSLKYLGNLLHLRYLALRNTRIDHLPEEIGNLQFLQTLDVKGYLHSKNIRSLPSTIIRLTQLMCLQISIVTRLPKGFRSMAALEELVGLRIDDNDTAGILEDLGHLTELKVLDFYCFHYKACWASDKDKSLVECLHKLHKIQRLIIRSEGKCNLEGWVVTTQHLRSLTLKNCLYTLPAWLNPSLLRDLSYLDISVSKLQQEDIRILGMFPALHYLHLQVENEDLGIHGRFTVGACWFPCLMRCALWGIGGPVVFQEGAMPSLAILEMSAPFQMLSEINLGLDWGLGNLMSLQDVCIWLRSEGNTVVAEAASSRLRHAILAHPNHPTFTIKN